MLFVLLQRCLPTRFLSWLVFKVTRVEGTAFKNALIRNFVKLYAIDLKQAIGERAEDYAHFNAFFTRALKPGMRPLEPGPDVFVSPVDGTMSQVGAIEGGRIFQAKGHDYSAAELLGDAALAEPFKNGSFCTIYLAPNNYHRIHMPVDGRLREWLYVPGRLFSVNPTTVASLPRVFARNERVVTLFDTPFGPFALVLVGALFVGSMETVWAGLISPPHRRSGISRHTPDRPVTLTKGDEMGRFNMGSTVILLAPPGAMAWSPALGPQMPLRMGTGLGKYRSRP